MIPATSGLVLALTDEEATDLFHTLQGVAFEFGGLSDSSRRLAARLVRHFRAQGRISTACGTSFRYLDLRRPDGSHPFGL